MAGDADQQAQWTSSSAKSPILNLEFFVLPPCGLMRLAWLHDHGGSDDERTGK
jgi:hypothetical protein